MGWFKRWIPLRSATDDEFRTAKEQILERVPVPVFWLFGKTGSGKTSVVKFLTGAERAEIGSGFRPQTRQSQQYDFPSADWPVVRFLDTRGLGETHYDPSEDIEKFRNMTHVMIVTVRAKDNAVSEVIGPSSAAGCSGGSTGRSGHASGVEPIPSSTPVRTTGSLRPKEQADQYGSLKRVPDAS